MSLCNIHQEAGCCKMGSKTMRNILHYISRGNKAPPGDGGPRAGLVADAWAARSAAEGPSGAGRANLAVCGPVNRPAIPACRQQSSLSSLLTPAQPTQTAAATALAVADGWFTEHPSMCEACCEAPAKLLHHTHDRPTTVNNAIVHTDQWQLRDGDPSRPAMP